MPYCGHSRNSHRLPLPLRPPEGDPLPFLEVSLSHPGWLAEPMVGAVRIRRRGVGAVQQRGPAADASRNVEDRPDRCRRAPRMVSRCSRRVLPRRTDRDRGNPLRTPLAGTGQFFFRMKHRSSWRCSPIRAGHAGARCVRFARRQDHGDGRDGGIAPKSSPPTYAARACNCFARPSAPAAHNTCASCRPIWRPGCRSGRRLTSFSSTRRARASARVGAIRTFDGVGARSIWRRWRALN